MLDLQHLAMYTNTRSGGILEFSERRSKYGSGLLEPQKLAS